MEEIFSFGETVHTALVTTFLFNDEICTYLFMQNVAWKFKNNNYYQYRERLLAMRDTEPELAISYKQARPPMDRLEPQPSHTTSDLQFALPPRMLG